MAGNGYDNGWGGEPEYLATPPHDPYRADHPGHTWPDGAAGYAPAEYAPEYPDGYGQDNVAVYRAGARSTPRAGGPGCRGGRC